MFHESVSSLQLMSPKTDSALIFELVNEDRRNNIGVTLTSYTVDTKLEECNEKQSSNRSLITIYGTSDSSERYVRQIWPCAFLQADSTQFTQEVLLKGFDRLYVQYYREPSTKADEFVMGFSLKTVTSKKNILFI